MAEHLIMTWTLWTGDGGGSYDKVACYDDFDEMVRDMMPELTAGRAALIDSVLVAREEWDALETIDGLREIRR